MDRFPPATSRERDAQVLALCEAQLADEETLLADMLGSLRLVRAAFLERNLKKWSGCASVSATPWHPSSASSLLP